MFRAPGDRPATAKRGAPWPPCRSSGARASSAGGAGQPQARLTAAQLMVGWRASPIVAVSTANEAAEAVASPQGPSLPALQPRRGEEARVVQRPDGGDGHEQRARAVAVLADVAVARERRQGHGQARDQQEQPGQRVLGPRPHPARDPRARPRGHGAAQMPAPDFQNLAGRGIAGAAWAGIGARPIGSVKDETRP